jgi:hypothetical protein
MANTKPLTLVRSVRITGNPHLTLVSVAAVAVPASVLTAARKLKFSWILRRLSVLSLSRKLLTSDC